MSAAILAEPAVDTTTQVQDIDSTISGAPAPDASQSGDKGGQPQEGALPKLPEGISSHEQWLGELLAKENDPDRNDYTDEELDVLEAHYDGKLKPKTKEESEAKAEKDSKKTKAEGTTPDPKDKADEADVTPDAETFKNSSSLDLSIMKEVGAKTKTEVIEKIKGLRKAISGKLESDPGYKQTVDSLKTLQATVKSERTLWADLMQGKQEAVDYVAKNYGIQIAGKGSTVTPQQGATQTQQADPFVIPRDKFIDEDAADAVNGVLVQLRDKVVALEKNHEQYKKDLEAKTQEVTKDQATNTIIDHMVRVAEQMDDLKNIPNLREAIIKWHKGGQDDRMEYFNDMFELANEKKVDLMTAMEIDRGRKAALAVKQAEVKGRKEAYNQKPNNSLSDIQGRAVNQQEEYSDAEITNMIETGTMPDNWFDENDNPDPNRIPKKAWKEFWPGGKPF